jgi:hypothetical protein
MGSLTAMGAIAMDLRNTCAQFSHLRHSGSDVVRV